MPDFPDSPHRLQLAPLPMSLLTLASGCVWVSLLPDSCAISLQINDPFNKLVYDIADGMNSFQGGAATFHNATPKGYSPNSLKQTVVKPVPQLQDYKNVGLFFLQRAPDRTDWPVRLPDAELLERIEQSKKYAA
jgi:hypothetical protein